MITPAFRFEDFADAASAQTGFEAAFPIGSPFEPALQALLAMGAQCRSVTATTVACRYVDEARPVAGFCWYVALDAGAEKTVRRVVISATTLAV